MQQDATFNQGGMGFQQPLPNATAVLILGILSILLCCCYGILGVILGVIALVLAGKDRTLYANNPDGYTLSSYKNLNAGRICAIIGLILSSLYIVYTIWMIVMIGFDALSDPTLLQERIKDIFGQ